jgi:hypothetical protein
MGLAVLDFTVLVLVLVLTAFTAFAAFLRAFAAFAFLNMLFAYAVLLRDELLLSSFILVFITR